MSEAPPKIAWLEAVRRRAFSTPLDAAATILVVLLFAWLVVLACCIVMTVFYTMSWGVCNTDEIRWDEGFIDFYPFHFMFPAGKNSVGYVGSKSVQSRD